MEKSSPEPVELDPSKPHIDYLITPIDSLPHSSPFIKKRLKSLVGPQVIDLFRHLPTSFHTRHFLTHLDLPSPEALVTITVTIDAHQKGHGRSPYKIHAHDEAGVPLTLVYFNARQGFLKGLMPIGEKRTVSGKLEKQFGQYTMVHPDWVGTAQQAKFWMGPEPIYPLTAGLSLPTLRKIMIQALKVPIRLPEWLPAEKVTAHGWPSWMVALRYLHEPPMPLDPQLLARCRDRLAFDELFAHQLALLLFKKRHQRESVSPLCWHPFFADRLQNNLPFSLTEGQKAVVEDISHDLQSGNRMIRLLQGDVGSGKTIIAFITMLCVASAGKQAALLVPTEVLARQHAASLAPLAEKMGISWHLLLGATTEKNKKRIKDMLAAGSTNLIIGTHALLEETVTFDDLAFVVIDEQHRFGVRQRQALVEKAPSTHVLIMTATPIPRTLLLSAYGDLDISRLLEKPAGRLEIQTKVISLEKIGDVIAGLGRALDRGDKAYWVCPLIETSEASDLAAATVRHTILKTHFGEKVGLVHGRMKPEEKDMIIQQFKGGEILCLVATTVIEVGVDISDANTMIIEHAERFGLSQLHQLRGRVGRGNKPSSCLLLYSPPLSPTAQERLAIMRETNDGFLIAEKDLKLRGAGEILGTRQSGTVIFRNAHPESNPSLLEEAHLYANKLLEDDPSLESNGRNARILLKLYGNHVHPHGLLASPQISA